MEVGRGKTLEKILQKAFDEKPLSKSEMLFILGLSNRKEIDTVARTARALRQRKFGSRVFVYGFLYFSTHCRNNCSFCLYRSSNDKLLRYRKEPVDIIDTAYRLAESGVHLLDLTMGEDPHYFAENHGGFSKLYSIITAIKEQTGLPIMVSPGMVARQVLLKLRQSGADWYACYQETHNRELFAKMRLGQSFDQRMEKKISAHRMGLLIEEGLLTGIGETDEDVVHSLIAMQAMNADQVRVMSFVPQQNTPMEKKLQGNRLRELLIISLMRLTMPDRLIPASLDVDGLEGLRGRLDAGANVVTSIIPPCSGMAGVARSTLDINEGNRSMESILPVLEQAGLTVAARDDYKQWIQTRKAELRSSQARTLVR